MYKINDVLVDQFDNQITDTISEVIERKNSEGMVLDKVFKLENAGGPFTKMYLLRKWGKQGVTE
ncbi:MAG: hypothetical protein JRD89_20495 [Deltaproteobacteria bacterium]|nr:hypothetical protein [Deltaproteobacteria bacterium]